MGWVLIQSAYILDASGWATLANLSDSDCKSREHIMGRQSLASRHQYGDALPMPFQVVRVQTVSVIAVLLSSLSLCTTPGGRLIEDTESHELMHIGLLSNHQANDSTSRTNVNAKYGGKCARPPPAARQCWAKAQRCHYGRVRTGELKDSKVGL